MEMDIPPPPPAVTFTLNSPPALAAPSLVGMAKFMRLLNEKYPIARDATNFLGNHSVVFDTTGLSVGQPCLLVTVWVWKQLEWRCYPVGLTDVDEALSPEALIEEIDRVLKPQLEKLIVPSRGLPPKQG